MFIDEIKIYAQAGHGGKGCVAFQIATCQLCSGLTQPDDMNHTLIGFIG
jgi:hypothetical protein